MNDLIISIEEAGRCMQPGETEAEFMYRHAFYYAAAYTRRDLETCTAYAEYAQGCIVQNPEEFAYWGHPAQYELWARATGRRP